MNAALEISLRIGQHVRHRDYQGKRVTGVIRGLSLDSEGVLCADVALDEAIVFPPIEGADYETRIHRQCVPVQELAPFDEREELIAGMLALLRRMEEEYDDHAHHALALFIDEIRAQIAKAGGAA